MESKMSGTKEEKPKTVLLFYISQSLFKNKRLKRRLAGKKSKKTSKKRTKTKPKTVVTNGRPTQEYIPPLLSETIEIISTDDEKVEDQPPIQQDVETSIVLSSGDEDDIATQARIFPMLTSETTVQTAVGNAVYELSLTQLKENLETITKKKKKKSRGERLSKRLKNNNTSVDLSISLLSDDDEDNNLNKSSASTAAAQV